ncbi:Two component regulator three Y domain-containing protein [Flagellimonas hymeniacidonis]|uniref:Two component regulator three Y domain-containing protein n=1 Tax=Flagellimonas hymeniacidonis TaxID=2603628 RepID=A0A5C8V621_9FLAO|nr:Two component regulator three Y domain-containing protein [Flagellimonas hymeniacidonis]TXN37162.1 Two component regulator three Y domain-containing protein [Flagellimonas hymeniacidonis]
MFNSSKTIILICLIPIFTFGQNLLPPIYNYKPLEYKGASKNWGLAVNKQGELFVANNKGLLYFNGEQWSLNKLPNNTIIRSVASVEDRIYTGSYEEFGFWKKNEKGILTYASLTHLIKNHPFTSEEFWEIIHHKNKILFRSFSSIYMYSDDEIEVIDPPEIISDIVTYKDRLIVAAGPDGLYELVGEQISPLKNQELLLGKTVTDMVVVGESLLVGTKLNGCFLFNGSTLQSWNTPLNEELKMHQLNKIQNLTTGKIAFGTIKNGVYLFDQSQGTSQILNRESGLQNNTVLSLLQYDNQLWLGLDNGIARVRLNNPITYYTDYYGTLGMVYDMAFYDNRLYVGSNTGVFYFENNKLEFVNGSQGHVWDLQIIDGDLLCGHNTGTFKIMNSSLDKISPFSGGYEIKKVPTQNTTYIQGTYNGLVKYSKNENNVWTVKRIDGIDFPVKQLCFETPNTLWVAHPYKGFYRIQINSSFDEITSMKQYDGDKAPSKYNVKIYNIKNQIVFSNDNTWYKYDPILDRIVYFEEFQKYNNRELLFYDNTHFWFVDSEEKKEITNTNLRTDSLLIADLQLRERLVSDSQNMIKINDSVSYITLNDGFAKIDRSAFQKQLDSFTLPMPTLNAIKDEKNSYTFNNASIKIPFKHSQHIIIEVASPKLIQPRYYYELNGPKSYQDYASNGFVDFQNLPYGSYEFQVSTVGIDNTRSKQNSIKFDIAPPWYLSKISIALYVLAAISAVFIIRWYNARKLERKREELESQMKKEQKEKLATLEKEKLAKEIKLKQNELASTTLNIAKKNEMILELKNMLVLHKDKFANSQRYRSFIKKLNNSVKDTEDWKRFEVNFKELHEDFFERLLKEYPTLTPKDLKLCAYLKMNLSTKEIAPLMAITIRGVEIHRYRLRKKLQIDSSKNLSNFLITF